MQSRRTIFIALAIIIGLGTMFMMRSALSNKGTVQASNKTEILVAAANVPAGQFIQQQHLRWQPWAPEHVTEAFVKKGPDVNGQDMVGAVARQSLRAGEPILKGQLVKSKDRGFLAAVLNAGMRAVAAPITNVTGIAGFVFPGDRIDLILTHSINAASDEKTIKQRRASVTIVRDVRVLALDQDSSDQTEGKPKVAKVVTLEVTPKQAEVLTLALQLGTISLSLRSLANDEQQLAEGKQDDGQKKAIPIGFERYNDYTLDSEVSNIIPRPSEGSELTGQIVQVLRGSKSRGTENFQEEKAD